MVEVGGPIPPSFKTLGQRLDAHDFKHIALNLPYDLHPTVVLLLGLFEVGQCLLSACLVEG